MNNAEYGENFVTVHYDFTRSLPTAPELAAFLGAFSSSYNSQLEVEEQRSNLLHAWQVADEQARQAINSGQEPTALATCVYLALIYTTLNSLLPSNVTSIDLDEQLWGVSPDEAQLHDAPVIPETYKDANYLVSLLSQSTGDALTQQLSDFVEIMLASSSSDWTIFDTIWRAYQPHLDEALIEHLLPRLQTGSNEAVVAAALRNLNPAMNDAQRETAYALALTIVDPWLRAFGIIGVIDELGELRKTEAAQSLLSASLAVEDVAYRLNALRWLLPHLEGEQLQQVIGVSLETMRASSRWNEYQLQAMAEVADDEMQKQIIEVVRTVASPIARARALYALVDYLPQEQQIEVLDAALAIRDPVERVEALLRLFDTESLQTQYASIVQSIEQSVNQIRNSERRASAWTKIEDARKKLQDENEGQIVELSTLIPKFDAAAKAALNTRWFGYALANLAQYLSGDLQDKIFPFVLENALQEYFSDYVADAVEVIAPSLPAPLIDVAFDTAFELSDALSTVWTFSGLLPYLRDDQRKRAITECLKVADAVQDKSDEDYLKIYTAVRLIPFLEGEVRERVLRVGLNADWGQFYNVYANLLKYVDESNRQQMLSHLFQTKVQYLEPLADESIAAAIVTHSAPYVQGDLIRIAIEAAQRLTDPDQRNAALSGLAARLEGENGLSLALTLESQYWRASALRSVAIATKGPIRVNAVEAGLESAQQIEATGYRLASLVWFLDVVENRVAHLRTIRHATLDHLWAMRTERSVEILALCASKEIFTSSIVPANALEQVGQYLWNFAP